MIRTQGQLLHTRMLNVRCQAFEANAGLYRKAEGCWVSSMLLLLQIASPRPLSFQCWNTDVGSHTAYRMNEVSSTAAY